MSDSLLRLKIATKPDEALKTADLVVEAVVENIDLKRKIFSEYDKIAPAKTIFASNTSSLPIGDIAVATPDRDLVNIHIECQLNQCNYYINIHTLLIFLQWLVV